MTASILVTGAAGCVGQACLEKLVAIKAKVVALDKASPPATAFSGRWIVGDICDPETYNNALNGIEVVIHLAAKAHSIARTRDEAAEFWRVNMAGTRGLIAAAVDHGVRRFIHVSTVAVMAPTVGNVQSAYVDSKRAAEQEVLKFGDRIQVVIARPTTVYGPNDRGNVFKLIRWVDRRLPVVIGTGNNKKSLVFTRNLADALLFLSERGAQGNVYTVTDGRDLTMREIVLGISNALGRGNRLVSIPDGVVKIASAVDGKLSDWFAIPRIFGQEMLGKLTRETVFDPSALFTLGFAPSYSFEMGMKETVRWYRGSAH